MAVHVQSRATQCCMTVSQETSNYECRHCRLSGLTSDWPRTTEMCACRLMLGVPAARLKLGLQQCSSQLCRSVQCPVDRLAGPGHMHAAMITAVVVSPSCVKVPNSNVLCRSLMAGWNSIQWSIWIWYVIADYVNYQLLHLHLV